MIGVKPADTASPATVWIFHGEEARFASGVFADREQALQWVARHRRTGMVTEYQVGDGCYDLAVREGRFAPTKPHHGSPSHVAGFSPNRVHIHLSDGQPDRRVTCVVGGRGG